MPAKPLTSEQKEDAARLRALFKEWQHARKARGEPSSQMEAAAQLEFGQSALSQYLRGDIPLNITVVAKFVRLLNCRFEEISPALAEKATELASAVDVTFHDSSTGKVTVGQVKSGSTTTNSGNTEEVVNPSFPDSSFRVNNDLKQIAQRFADELLAAVAEGRVAGETLDALISVFRIGVVVETRGTEHLRMTPRARRGSRKRGTGT